MTPIYSLLTGAKVTEVRDPQAYVNHHTWTFYYDESVDDDPQELDFSNDPFYRVGGTS